MAYPDKVQAELASAQETAIANKILDMMRDLKLKNDNTTACRWVWELIQNAKDVVDSPDLVNIIINFNEEKEYLSFEHDGKCFTTKNMVHLISQVSSKERDQSTCNGVTGKFGTGFLTTHLLSEKVIIDSFLQDEDEPVKKIKVLLDRSGETKEEVIQAVKKSFAQLEASDEVSVTVVEKRNGFNTCFFYELDQNGIEIARNGLQSLYASISYVFAFIEKLNSIRINNTLYIRHGEKLEYGDMCIHTIQRIESGIRENCNILQYHNGKVDLAIPIILRGEEVFIDEYPENMPKLFCDFPLIGTEDFSFPIVVNSPYFNPNEPRNGVYLTDKESPVIEENKNLMIQALEAYKFLLDCAAAKGWKQVYNIVRVPKQVQKQWISREWLKDNIIEACKACIRKSEIIDTISGERKSLYNVWDYQDVFIIGDSEQSAREQVWKLAQSIYSDRIVLYSEVHKWYSSLWQECKNFNMDKLIATVEECGCLERLESKMNGVIAIDWLNNLYKSIDFLGNTENYTSAKIYPNQLGRLCSIQELYFDDGVEDIYKQILALLGNECRQRLLDKQIQLPNTIYCEVYDYESLFDEILRAMNNDAFSYREALAVLIVLYDNTTQDDNEQINLLYLLESIFKDEIPQKCKVKIVNADVMEKARNYWCFEIADKVCECETVEILARNLKLPEGQGVWEWLKEFIEYLGKYKHKNLFERKTKPILPNQNGKFITMETLFLDSGEIDEIFKDILLEVGNDIRSILLPLDIYLELPESRVKKLKDVSQGVIDYVKDNQGKVKNQDETVRNNFNRLFCWINDNPDKARVYFKEVVENKHWLYNDEEIAENLKKAEKYDDFLSDLI